MTIHHATLKKAEANGVALKEVAPDLFEGFWPERKLTLSADTAKLALEQIIQAKICMKEYPNLKIVQDGNTFSVMRRDEALAEGENLKEVISEALDGLDGDDEGEFEDAEGDEDETEEGGSIVKPKYRQEYKARGNPNHCGDWLAVQFANFASVMVPGSTRTVKAKDGTEKTIQSKAKQTGDVAKHYAIGAANGIDRTWPNLNNGQQCMNLRNMVRAKLVKTGDKLVVPKSVSPTHKQVELAPDANWLEALRARRPANAKAKAE